MLQKLKFANYDNLGNLHVKHNFGRKAIMQHIGHLKNFFGFANKPVIYNLNPSVPAVHFELHEKLV